MYVDVNGWHLYLKDMKGFPLGLANAFALQISGGERASDALVEATLKKVAVKARPGPHPPLHPTPLPPPPLCSPAQLPPPPAAPPVRPPRSSAAGRRLSRFWT